MAISHTHVTMHWDEPVKTLFPRGAFPCKGISLVATEEDVLDMAKYHCQKAVPGDRLKVAVMPKGTVKQSREILLLQRRVHRTLKQYAALLFNGDHGLQKSCHNCGQHVTKPDDMTTMLDCVHEAVVDDSIRLHPENLPSFDCPHCQTSHWCYLERVAKKMIATKNKYCELTDELTFATNRQILAGLKRMKVQRLALHVIRFEQPKEINNKVFS